jgi:hypothetical protein
MKTRLYVCRTTFVFLAVSSLVEFASADQFCEEIQRAVQEGKKEFVQIKGSKTPDSDAVVTDYRSSLQIQEVRSDLGCELEADSDRPGKLSLQCLSDSSTDEGQVRAQFNDLGRQFTQCIQTQFPKSSGPDRSSSAGDDTITYTNLAETSAGWQLRAVLRFHTSENKRHPERTKYSVGLTIGPE